jgi:hypothetical protein
MRHIRALRDVHELRHNVVRPNITGVTVQIHDDDIPLFSRLQRSAQTLQPERLCAAMVSIGVEL